MKENKINYEEELKNLEALINKMELESTSLDDSVKLYEEASKIIKKLEDYLLDMKNVIKEMVTVK